MAHHLSVKIYLQCLHNVKWWIQICALFVEVSNPSFEDVCNFKTCIETFIMTTNLSFRTFLVCQILFKCLKSVAFDHRLWDVLDWHPGHTIITLQLMVDNTHWIHYLWTLTENWNYTMYVIFSLQTLIEDWLWQGLM